MDPPETARRLRPLLDALAAGPASARALAEELGLALPQVEEAVGRLRRAGFEIEHTDGTYEVRSVPAYGLGVAYGLEAPFAIEYHRQIGSTNDRARELAEAGEADVVVLADEQSGGRGRRGRAWWSPVGGVWLSVLLRPELDATRAGLLALLGATAVAEAVPAGVMATIKWPNDVLVGDRKLAGVLVETEIAAGRIEWAAVGIGVNADVVSTELPPGATSLREHIGTVDRGEFVRNLLVAVDHLRADPDRIPERWCRHAGTLGRRVRVKTPDGEVVGEALDVDGSGALLVDTGSNVTRVTVGECEHLRPV